jgi:hypothetical protein
MDRWKGWQVDMRGWRSLGIGPTFEIWSSPRPI